VQRVEEAKAEQRALNGPGPVRRWLRRAVVSVAVIFAVLGGGSGTAQAWPWDDAVENVGQFVLNFCGPEDLPTFTNGYGVDTVFGLNKNRNNTHTIAPDVSEDLAGESGKAIDRLNKYYTGNDKSVVAKPTYERYGFSTLKWTNFGAGCFSIGYWFSSINNFALTGLVHIPSILSMAVLQLAMGEDLYVAFKIIIQPIVKIFNAVFMPWVPMIAVVGVAWAFIRSRGSLQVTLKAAVWVICIFGVFLMIGGPQDKTGWIITKAFNVVTDVTGRAACELNKQTQGSECDPNDPMKAIHQSLWYGVPYQVWLSGEVGDQQAKEDVALAKQGKVGIGPAVLNGMYVNTSDDKNAAGNHVLTWRSKWNSASYAGQADEGNKLGMWTGSYDDGEDGWWGGAWRNIPFLAAVKFMCNDTVQGGEDSDSEEDNRWFYGGSCDSRGAGTAHMVGSFTGQAWNEQIVTAFAGGVAALAVMLAVGVAAMYLALQKMLFFFLLAFAPLFLAISTFADEKRRQFAIKYFEVLVANLIKQCAAVCAVLFVSHAMGTLMVPPEDFPDIPWILKPYLAILFFVALLLFAVPMKNILTAAVAGDASVVQKTANAPVNAAKTAGKAAVAAGVIAATGGAAAPAALGGLGSGAGAAGGLAKSATLLNRAGSMMGNRGGVGRMLHTAGRGMSLADSVGAARAQRLGRSNAVKSGAELLASGPGGNKYQRDAAGRLTAAGRQQAEGDFKALAAPNARASQASQAQQAFMQQAFRNHQLKNGGQFHPSDPNSPANLRAGGNVAGLPQGSQRNGSTGRLLGESENRGTTGIQSSSDFTDGGSRALNGHQSTEQYFGQQARAATSGPEFGRSEDIRATVNLSGADVLGQAGLTRGEVEANPVRLLTSDSAYGGGDTTRMDPMHPSTEALTNLRFAASSGDEQSIQVAVLAASESIAQHGVPSEISQVRSYGEAAQSFEPMNVVGAMPNLSADASWQERADSAVTMQSAMAQLPAEHPASNAMQSYVEALSNPAVDLGAVNALKVQAIETFEQAAPQAAPQPIPVAELPASSGTIAESEGLPDAPAPRPAGPAERPPAADWANEATPIYDSVAAAVRDGLRDARDSSVQADPPAADPGLSAGPAADPAPAAPIGDDRPTLHDDDEAPTIGYRPTRRRRRYVDEDGEPLFGYDDDNTDGDVWDDDRGIDQDGDR
jgi:hypothetical protein